MKDPRIAKLCKNLLGYSVKLKKGQSIIIEASYRSREIVVELVRQVYAIGAYPFVRISEETINREVMMGMTEELSKTMCKYTLPMFEGADAYIGIYSAKNSFESADVPLDKKTLHAKHYGKPIHVDVRCAKKNWVILDWPSPSMAQMAQMSYEAFEDFYFDVCTMDYAKMHKAMLPLKALMEKTDKVRIVAPDTDLTFSIKGQLATPCAGTCNIPDGELMTSPVRDSANGKIKFNIPSLHNGIIHSDIELEFKDGKVINASSSDTKSLIKELDGDEGARYLGEFAFGVNPFITKPMNNTLFDEKISGSIHLACGNGYPENYKDQSKVNHSQLHWDIILKGGEVYFDGKLIRKNGLFLPKELTALNPENLKK
ncbi:MAG: aminopeptidase [Christensenellaceae bacterium]|jgi:aminopeptidase|nr:aminopeptidase [Christensenellaceae bacterium]